MLSTTGTNLLLSKMLYTSDRPAIDQLVLSRCSSAVYQALHAAKALHGLWVLHSTLEKATSCVYPKQNKPAACITLRVILIDLGHSRLCTPESALQQELLQTEQLFT